MINQIVRNFKENVHVNPKFRNMLLTSGGVITALVLYGVTTEQNYSLLDILVSIIVVVILVPVLLIVLAVFDNMVTNKGIDYTLRVGTHPKLSKALKPSLQAVFNKGINYVVLSRMEVVYRTPTSSENFGHNFPHLNDLVFIPEGVYGQINTRTLTFEEALSDCQAILQKVVVHYEEIKAIERKEKATQAQWVDQT